MTLCIFLFLLILCFIFPNKETDKARQSYIIIASIVLILISGLRNRAVGNDTYAYIIRFQEMTSNSWREIFNSFWIQYFTPSADSGKDPGYALFAKCISVFTTNEHIYLTIVALVFYIPLGILFYRHSESVGELAICYSAYLFFYFTYLPNSAVRQTIAVAIIIVAFLRLEKDKVLQATLFILFASTFHQSAIGVLLMIPLLKINKVFSVYYSFVIGFLIMLVFYQEVASFLASSNSIYDSYSNSDFYARDNAKPFLVFIAFLIFYLIGCFAQKNNDDGIGYRLAAYGMGMALMLSPLIWYDPSAIRLTAYFGIWIGPFLAISLRGYSLKGRTRLVILLLMMALFKAGRHPAPYKFYWQEMNLHERYGQAGGPSEYHNPSISIYYESIADQHSLRQG